MNVDEKLKEIFCSLFLLQPHQIYEKLSPSEVSTWDSLQHLNLVLAIEDTFGIMITPEESTEMLNYSLIALLIKEKIRLGTS